MVAKELLQQAASIYRAVAYPPPAALPPAVESKLQALADLPPGDVPASFLEPAPGLAGNALALRLGQPLYPHMKLIVETCGTGPTASGALFRVDTHDKHLHAPPGSPDEAWLAKIRLSNKDLTEKIESQWIAEGLPTFKGYLRRQLEERKRNASQS